MADAPTEMYVCSNCIGESFLSAEVAESGDLETCSVCETSKVHAISIDGLAERIHGVIERHFYLTSPEPEHLAREGLWEQPGEPVLDLLQILAGIDEEPAQAIHDYLSATYDAWGKDALVDPQPYDSDAQYEERPINSYEFADTWARFKNEVGSRSRYFNLSARASLDHIFDGISALETKDGDPVIREISPDQPDTVFYRARKARSLGELEVLLKNLPESLAPPASNIARAGRMNATGISVFYGALDEATCLAEIRAPVGSWVATCGFTPVRDLRLLDLGRFKNVFLEGSIFDDEHIEALTRLHFLKQLVYELSAPVMPGDEESKYLPTQVVAEYLSTHPDLNLDGVVFPSSQVAGDGDNVVLFNRASVVEPSGFPDGTEISVSFGSGNPDDEEYDFVVFERVPEAVEKKPVERYPLFDFSTMYDSPELGKLPDLEPTLRIDLESLSVSHVQGVSYDTDAHKVSRFRSTFKPGEEPEF